MTNANFNKQKAEQDVSWIGARLREPSTYAGLAAFLAAVHLTTNPTGWAQVLMFAGEGLGAAIAIVMPEAGSAAVIGALIAGSLLLISGPVQAADVNKPAPIFVKAPLLSQPYSGSGFYTGLEGGMAAGSAPKVLSGVPIAQYRRGNDPVPEVPLSLPQFPFVHMREPLIRVGAPQDDPFACHHIDGYVADVRAHFLAVAA